MDNTLIKIYNKHHKAWEIAALLGVTADQVYHRAFNLGLSKR